MTSPSYLRQRDWYDPSRHGGEVVLIGAGGIGSVVALCLAKLGIPRISIIDPDRVEPHNLPNQMFWTNQIGLSKVAAADDVIAAANPGCEVNFVASRFEDWDHDWERGIVISGLDSMAARAAVWERLRGKLYVPLYIDGRLGGQKVVVYAVNPLDPDDQRFYESTLHSDSEAQEDPCTARAIIDVSFAIAAQITRIVRLHLTGERHERAIVLNCQTNELSKGE